MCGSRTWRNVELICDVIDRLPTGTVVLHGDCPTGADAIADAEARSRSLSVERWPADWRKYGTRAGPIRNQHMIDNGQPDRVIAFMAGTTPTRGTQDMVTRADKAGIPVRIFHEPPRVEAWV